MLILIERSHIVELDRLAIDARLDPQGAQRGHVFGVKIGDGARVEPDEMLTPGALPHHEVMRHQIKLHFERIRSARNSRRAESARCDVKRDVPPMIFERRQSQARLAHDLRPHVERVAGVFPLRVRKRRPLSRVQASPHRCSTTPSPRPARSTLRWGAWSNESAWSHACFWRNRSNRRARMSCINAGEPTCRPSSGIPRIRGNEASRFESDWCGSRYSWRWPSLTGRVPVLLNHAIAHAEHVKPVVLIGFRWIGGVFSLSI